MLKGIQYDPETAEGQHPRLHDLEGQRDKYGPAGVRIRTHHAIQPQLRTR